MPENLPGSILAHFTVTSQNCNWEDSPQHFLCSSCTSVFGVNSASLTSSTSVVSEFTPNGILGTCRGWDYDPQKSRRYPVSTCFKPSWSTLSPDVNLDPGLGWAPNLRHFCASGVLTIQSRFAHKLMWVIQSMHCFENSSGYISYINYIIQHQDESCSSGLAAATLSRLSPLRFLIDFIS